MPCFGVAVVSAQIGIDLEEAVRAKAKISQLLVQMLASERIVLTEWRDLWELRSELARYSITVDASDGALVAVLDAAGWLIFDGSQMHMVKRAFSSDASRAQLAWDIAQDFGTEVLQVTVLEAFQARGIVRNVQDDGETLSFQAEIDL